MIIQKCLQCGAKNRVLRAPAKCGKCRGALAVTLDNSNSITKPTVFISYSHKDRTWKDEILTQLGVLESQGILDSWDDSRIGAGEDWYQRIQETMASARVAILLVSANFLASKFILQEEVICLLQRRAKEGLHIVPVIFGPCHWESVEWLRQMQIRPEGVRALSELRKPQRQNKLAAITKEVYSLLEECEIAFSPLQSGYVLPLNYQPRPNLMSPIMEALLSQEVIAGGRTCILTGPSGFGKSTIAAEVYEKWDGPKDWFDASRPLKPANYMHKEALLVIDNLDRALDFLDLSPGDIGNAVCDAMPWIGDVAGSLFILSTLQEVPRLLLGCLGRANDSNTRIINIEGFTPEECLEFLNRTVDSDLLLELGENTKLKLNDYIRGCPLVWQLVTPLINAGSLPEIFSFSESEHEQAEVIKKIFNLWLSKIEETNGLTGEIARVLCCISSIGMSSAALAYVLENSQDEVEAALKPLINRGFVRRASPADRAWSPHSLLRAACEAVPNNTMSDHLKRYRQYLGHMMKAGHTAQQDFLTLLDAWVVGVHQTFSDSFSGNNPQNTEAFFNRYSALLNDLENIFRDNQGYKFQPRWLAELFRGQIDRICSELIPSARVISLIPHRNKTFAEIMWLATKRPPENQDGYTNAECIRAAAFHWSEQGMTVRDEGAERLQGRIEELISNQGLPLDYCLDLELSALLGGLCVLEKIHWAVKNLDEKSLTAHQPETCLTVLLFLVDNCRTEDVTMFLSKYWELIPNMDLKYFVESYLLSKDFNISRKTSGEIIYNPNRVCFFANMAHARPFEKYVYQLFKNGAWIDEKMMRLIAL